MQKPNPWHSFLRGFGTPLQALRLFGTQRRLIRFALLPLICAMLAYVLCLALAIYGLEHWDWSSYRFEFLGEYLGRFVSSTLEVFKWLIFIPLLLVWAYVSFTAVGLVLASPFNELLSEQVERAVCDQPPGVKVPLQRWLAGTLRALLDSFSLVFRQLFFSILALPLLLIPVVGAVPLLAISAYFSGRGYFEIATARHFLRRQHLAPVLRARRWELFGMGVAIQLLFLIPFVGLLVLPVGVAAGTLAYCRVDWAGAWQEDHLTPPVGFQPPKPRAGSSED